MAWPKHDELYEKIRAEYDKGFSLAQVAQMFSISRQAIFEGFKNRGWKMRSVKPLPYQFFKGRKYTLRNTGYYGLTTNDRRLMHREVWEEAHGPIPPSYDVHHKDHNRANNRLENLELINKADHTRLHENGKETRFKSRKSSENGSRKPKKAKDEIPQTK